MNFNVAASDFDGTLYRGGKISEEDLSAIRAWRAAGNKFGIVTGRCRLLIEALLKKFGVELDYLICDNGAIIYDGAMNAVFETELSKKILLAIMAEPCVQSTCHFGFETANEIFVNGLKPDSWLIKDGKQLNFTLKEIEASQIENLPRVNQFALGFNTPEIAQSVADELNEKFGKEIFAQKNLFCVDIVTAGINKAQGVENLLRIMNWNDAKVFIIGDEANDLPGIRKFGGYTVSTAKDYVKKEAAAVFESVGAMLKNFS